MRSAGSAPWGVVALLAALVAAGVGAVVLARPGLDAPPSPPVAMTQRTFASVIAGSVVHLDPTDPGQSFLPLFPGPRQAHTLSAQSAYDALLGTPRKLNPIPVSVRAYFGLLNDASTAPSAVGLQVWGFAVDSGCRYVGSADSSTAVIGAHPGRCRQWEFVDARTGHALGVTEQEVLPD
jgi:hypothetical protein